MQLTPSAANALIRMAFRPLLNPRIPLPVRRRLIDAAGYVTHSPRGTRRTRTTLGGVPTTTVTAPGAVGPHLLLYLHGGGYTIGSAQSHRGLLGHLSKRLAAPVHAPDYRLAPEHPFPAAVDDVAAAYRALLAAGHDAQRIAVAGDSAGGGLAMSLLLRLRSTGEPLPGAVGLISPFVDMTLSSPTIDANAASDALLPHAWLPVAPQDYARGSDSIELRPLEADLTGLPPIHVLAATGEMLLGDADALVARLTAAGAPPTYDRVEGYWHDFVLLAGLLPAADTSIATLCTHLQSATQR